jgi:hypothetical protein
VNRLLLLLLLVGPLLARGDDQKRIADLYARGLAGDKQAVTDCIAALDARLAQEPGDQLARVYLGSAWTLRSRDLPIGPGKLSALRHGIALMDEAASAAPDNDKILLLRAITNQALPGFLGRKKLARAQLEELLASVEKNPEKLSPTDRELLYLKAGAAARHAGEETRARELWKRGLAIKADPGITAEIEQALAK